jgi:hypothetical protein
MHAPPSWHHNLTAALYVDTVLSLSRLCKQLYAI